MLALTEYRQTNDQEKAQLNPSNPAIDDKLEFNTTLGEIGGEKFQ